MRGSLRSRIGVGAAEVLAVTGAVLQPLPAKGRREVLAMAATISNKIGDWSLHGMHTQIPNDVGQHNYETIGAQ